MERQFGSAKTLFRRRFECFKMRYEGQEFNNYELLVKTKCANAKLDAIDFDGLQCLFYVAGFQGPEFADYRTRLLRKLDQSEKVTLKDLTAECQLIRSYKEDSQMLEGDPSVNFVRRKRAFRGKKKHVPRNGPNAFRYSSDQKEPKQRSGSTISHRRNRQVNNVIAALKKDDHPHLGVFINGHPTELLLDTGAEITIISESKWKQIGAPQLQRTDVTGFAANGTPLKIRGCFEADFSVNSASGGLCLGRGTCFVADDDCNVFGMPWIKQLPDLYKAVRKYQIHRTIIVDHVSASRKAVVEKLKTKFATVFKSGLGRCTRTKATLKLRADASPVFRKKRPVAYANVAVLDKEIDRLLAEDVLSPVTYSNTCPADTAMLMDQLDSPLLPCLNDATPTRDQDAEPDQDGPSMQPTDTFVSAPRQLRIRRPPNRLQVNPKKKTYTSSVSLRREVLDP
ncbi:unnamed protein product [Heligmosomoides polygyrus]|uniref:Peptidase A2 domain-containing protein n=1 Tax=Heligmosomoides polygyrus TaxID=6339 RepID=A0A183FNA2_HELPZ|nr:unnamed protein product [Heligmosomoides polygyrus]